MPGVATTERTLRHRSSPRSVLRRSGASVSGSRAIDAATTVATVAHIQNTACHGASFSSPADRAGANVGTRMNTAMINDICLAICAPE